MSALQRFSPGLGFGMSYSLKDYFGKAEIVKSIAISKVT